MSKTRLSEEVAVIVAARDAAATIARAVRSALAQSSAAEVIVVDDASGDATAEAARSADDRSGRLRLIALDRNVGPAQARNIALQASSAPLVCVLDADDYLLEGRLEALCCDLADADMAADDLLCTTPGADAATAERLVGDAQPLPRNLGFREFVLGNISRRGAPRRELGFLKPLMRRRFLDDHGLRYEPELRLGEDFILYATALALGARFRLVGPRGYVAVEHKTSLSSTHSGQDLAALLKAADALADRARLAPADAAAFARYRSSLRHKVHHRRVLDAKREQGWVSGISTLLSGPGSVPHVLINTLLPPHSASRPRRLGG